MKIDVKNANVPSGYFAKNTHRMFSLRSSLNSITCSRFNGYILSLRESQKHPFIENGAKVKPNFDLKNLMKKIF